MRLDIRARLDMTPGFYEGQASSRPVGKFNSRLDHIMKYTGDQRKKKRAERRKERKDLKERKEIYQEVSNIADRTAVTVKQQLAGVAQPPSVMFLQQKAMGHFPTRCEACQRRWFY